MISMLKALVRKTPDWQRWAITVLAGMAGAILNCWPIEVICCPADEYHIQILPGLLVGFGLFILFGLRWAVLGTALAALPTLFLWHTYLAIPVFILEIAVVGWLAERRGWTLPFADLVYWLAVGIPIWGILFIWEARVDQIGAAIMLIKQLFNGMVLAAVASLIILLVVGDVTRIRQSVRPLVYSIGSVLFNVLVVMILMPPLIILLIHTHLLGVPQEWAWSSEGFFRYFSLYSASLVAAILLAAWLNRLFIHSLVLTADAVDQRVASASIPRIRTRILEPDALNLALVQLVSEFQKEHKQVIRQTQWLERLVYRSPIAIWCGQVGQDGMVNTTFSNGAVEQLTGLKAIPDSLALMERVHPADRGKFQNLFRLLQLQGHAREEVRFMESSDHFKWVYFGISLLDSEPCDQPECISLMMDISELKYSQSQLVQAAKMAILGEMTTGFAHELNQPLQVIQLAADNAFEALEQDGLTQTTVGYVKARLSRITDQARRAADIIDHMRVFGRRSEQDDREITLVEVVDGVLSLVGQQLTVGGIQVKVAHQSPSVAVIGKLQPLEQVLLNCVSNARYALKERANLAAKQGDTEFVPMLDIRTYRCIREGREEAVLEIRDNGGGLSEEVMEHLFEPFFTTKPVGQGTGLGLSISYGIISDLGGRIECCNHDGGAVFAIFLPAIPSDISSSH